MAGVLGRRLELEQTEGFVQEEQVERIEVFVQGQWAQVATIRSVTETKQKNYRNSLPVEEPVGTKGATQALVAQ